MVKKVLSKIKELIEKKNEECPLPGGKKHVITHNIEEAASQIVQVVNLAEVKNKKERDKVMQKIKNG